MSTDKETDCVLTTLGHTHINSNKNSVKQYSELANKRVAAAVCISDFKNTISLYMW